MKELKIDWTKQPKKMLKVRAQEDALNKLGKVRLIKALQPEDHEKRILEIERQLKAHIESFEAILEIFKKMAGRT